MSLPAESIPNLHPNHEANSSDDSIVELVLLNPSTHDRGVTRMSVATIARHVQGLLETGQPSDDKAFESEEAYTTAMHMEATRFVLLSTGVLSDDPRQQARYAQLFPVMRDKAVDMPKSQVAAIMDGLEERGLNPVLEVFDSFRRQSRDTASANVMQYTAAVIMNDFVER